MVASHHLWLRRMILANFKPRFFSLKIGHDPLMNLDANAHSAGILSHGNVKDKHITPVATDESTRLTGDNTNNRLKCSNSEKFDPCLYCRNLTLMASKGLLDTFGCRELEMQRLVEILCKRGRNNVMLVGEAGVGKSAIVEYLSQMIVDGNVPYELHDYEIYSLDLSVFLGAQSIEKLVHSLIEWAESHRIILFIDEIHAIFNNTSNTINLLKPALSRGRLKCIGATTTSEYHYYITKDRAFDRRFQLINIKEPTVNESIRMLYASKENYESFHGVTLSNEAIVAACTLSARYINSKRLPDKAFDLLDEAATSVKLRGHSMPSEMHDVLLKIDELNAVINASHPDKMSRVLNTKRQQLNELLLVQKRYEELWIESRKQYNVWRTLVERLGKMKRLGDEYQRAGKLCEASQLLNLEIPKLESQIKDMNQAPLVVTGDDVFNIVKKWTGAYLKNFYDFSQIASRMKLKIIGHDKAIDEACRYLLRAHLKIDCSVASFLIAGPVGVGKVKFAKELCKAVLGDSAPQLLIDLSQYKCEASFSRLIGSPPGYVGYHKGGLLTEFVSANPNSQVVFTHCDKAHETVIIGLNGILQQGTLVDAKGQLHSFENVLLCFTCHDTKTCHPIASSVGKILQLETLDPDELKKLAQVSLTHLSQHLNRCLHLELKWTSGALETFGKHAQANTLSRVYDDVIQDIMALVMDNTLEDASALLLAANGELVENHKLLHASTVSIFKISESSNHSRP
ncbi:bifunctional P-loop containing nucleoside triphosphate hydrolase/ATPase [Babesia duncani]|uniref:Bifunctional P-loop containing nucleoside triphosphate hydrolase/ATPase n=1 Tax=Babesia duncani TaxID=323732 RepID=A0AAD9UPY1_9APIC|nr:bifunctional P-loop containing nucleoside triphosphate hydrolase/ATPase [Babesia duncani]